MRCHELSDEEWSIIAPLLPNNSRGVARVDDRLITSSGYGSLSSENPDLQTCSTNPSVPSAHQIWIIEG